MFQALTPRPNATNVQPWKNRSIARNRPKTQRLLTGQPRAMIMPASAVTMPASRIQPQPFVGLRRSPTQMRKIPATIRAIASMSVSTTETSNGLTKAKMPASA